jgi:hypothetical protein
MDVRKTGETLKAETAKPPENSGDSDSFKYT